MRVGVIGPVESVETVITEAVKADLPLTCVPLAYARYPEAVGLVSDHRDQVDAFLFTGTTPYNYTLRHMQPREAWAFLPRSAEALGFAMLKAVYALGRDIRRVSVDSYDEEDLHAAYAEMGIPEKDVVVLAHSFDVDRPDYVRRLIDFHEDNVRSGRSDFCLSGVRVVYAELEKRGIPVSRAFATSEMILQQLQKLYISQYVSRKEHRMAVLSVQARFSRERSLYGKSDMQFFLRRTEVFKEIYAFAQKIGASVEASDAATCRLYATEAAIAMETKGFTDLSLLRSLQKLDGILFVVAGIGLGDVPADAKYHADYGKDRAAAANRSGFFIVHDDHKIAGPIVVSPAKKRSVLVDRRLNVISRNTGIGLERICRIERAVRINGLETATPGELAALCGMSLCNMNRIIARLEQSGYARIIGKQPSASRGRPSRLVQILF